MDPVLSLTDLVAAIEKDEVRFTEHAISQMDRRLLFKADVVEIARTCTRFEWQPTKKTYLVVGYAENRKGEGFLLRI